MLQDKPKQTIQSKRSGRLSQEVILQHNGAQAHIGQHDSDDKLFRSNTTSTKQPGQMTMWLLSVWANKRVLRGKYFPNDKVLKIV
jgi:hypothetical protein